MKDKIKMCLRAFWLIPSMFIGYVLLLIGKVLKGVGALMLLKPYTAEQEFKNFLLVQSSILDS